LETPVFEEISVGCEINLQPCQENLWVPLSGMLPPIARTAHRRHLVLSGVFGYKEPRTCHETIELLGEAAKLRNSYEHKRFFPPRAHGRAASSLVGVALIGPGAAGLAYGATRRTVREQHQPPPAFVCFVSFFAGPTRVVDGGGPVPVTL
jgi:hypothetical protein